MNKTIKLILLSVVSVSVGYGIYCGIGSGKNGPTVVEVSKQDPVKGDTKASSETQPSEDSEKSTKNEISTATKMGDGVPPEKTVRNEVQNGKAVVLFENGKTITDEEINKKINDLPDQFTSRVSLADLRTLVAWNEAYKSVMREVAKKSGVMRSEDVRRGIKKRQDTVAGMMFIDKKVQELMTFDALKKDYGEFWEKNFKGTKDFSVVAVSTSDKNLADRVKAGATDELSLQKILDANVAKIKRMDMEARPQSSFPPEISDAVLKQGVKTVVGPFEIKGAYILFYVKSITDAKKKEFTKEFAEDYKKVAYRTFLKTFVQNMYKDYGVKFFDIDGKVVDPFASNPAKSESDKEINARLVKASKLADDLILATYKGGKVTVKDLKEFYKVETLLDQTFLSMAKQFGLGFDRLITYAVKLIVDDSISSLETVRTGYDKTPDVVSKLKEIEEREVVHAYFEKNIKVTKEDAKKMFIDFIKSIPEKDKNDHEIAVKLAFYPTREEAVKALKSINAGDTKFSVIYNEKVSKKEGVDLGYVKRQGTSPELWQVLKTGASGTCCKQVFEMNGAQFGVDDSNFAIAFIGDRRPVELPKWEDKNVQINMENRAKQKKATEIAGREMAKRVVSIYGVNLADFEKRDLEKYLSQVASCSRL